MPPDPSIEHMCPRRSERTAENQSPSPDRWVDDRYHAISDGTKIRTCSYCGGAHQEDVIRLILAGWDDSQSDKSYKGYLYPPGYLARSIWSREHHDHLPRFKRGPDDDLQVKFYAPHFTQMGLLTKLIEVAKMSRLRVQMAVKVLNASSPEAPPE